MGRNCVIFELATNHARDALLSLHRTNKINIVKWLGNEDDDSGVIGTHYGDVLSKRELELESRSCPDKIYAIVYKRLYVFLDMVSRTNDLPIYEKVNMFNLYVNYYYGLFTKREVDIVFFGDIPHFGVDSIAYDVAKAMGIKTLLFWQTNVANRFFCTTNVDDLGVFNLVRNTSILQMSVEDKYEKDLFYMKEIKVIEPDKINGRGLSFHKLYELLNRLKRNGENIPRAICDRMLTRCIAYLDIYLKRNEFHSKATGCMKNEVDFSAKYVYFALQFQPEQSTSAIGKEYCDQILAIERLAQLIPSDWKIYVKENPKQSYYMRQKYFFQRLALIEKAVYVARDVNTYDLIENSQFVATITGTVGWEAISGGKCALVFGLAWYRKLPGVFEYSSRLSLDEILQYKINHDEVESAYNELIGRSFEGIIQHGYEKMVPSYSDEKNVEYLKKSFSQILRILTEQ